MSGTEQTPSAVDNQRWLYGLIAVGLGLAVLLIALVIIVREFSDAADVGAIMGVISAPIGTMVAAYFGVAAGSSGKAQAEESAKKANETVVRMAGVASPEQAQSIIDQVYGR
ncbi:MAG TPA: hypothetical protein VMF51_04565 [Nocardioides sp.]|uniref:hypothetical protein n=1 Tax=Nocardioides sp. TaxID=35761 RepID=UPI002B997B58|nr:hypothetical protein [Nocardioides sp.]HTW14380.1 hypothetical protein [Nocardioides sp.]